MSQTEWDSVVKAANQEGEVVVYGVTSAALLAVLPQEFNKKYPNIKVTYVRLSPADIEARLGAEIAAGNIATDAFDNMPATVIDGFAAKGVLQPIAVPAVAVPEYDRKLNQRTATSAYASQSAFAWVWNSKLLPKGIKSWDDYLKLDPALVGVTDPSISSAIVSLYTAMEQPGTGGEGFLDKLMSKPTKPRVYAGSNPLLASLAAGEVAAGLPVTAGQAFAAKASGAPIDFALYPNSYSVPNEVGLLKGPHPNAAQVYINWLLSADGGQKMYASNGTGPIVPIPLPYDTSGIQFVRDTPLPADKFKAFQQRWSRLMS